MGSLWEDTHQEGKALETVCVRSHYSVFTPFRLLSFLVVVFEAPVGDDDDTTRSEHREMKTRNSNFLPPKP